jgi:hypothetical protein
MAIDSVLFIVDPYFIALFRLTGYAFFDFMFGTFALAGAAVLLGECCRAVAVTFTKSHVENLTDEMVTYQNLSVDAIGARDKNAFKAANKMANESFGRVFFIQVASSAALVWPIFLALAWLQFRFGEVDFPVLFTDYTTGFFPVFAALYAACYVLFKRIKYKVPYFRRIQMVADSFKDRTRRMKKFEDLVAPDAKAQKV